MHRDWLSGICLARSFIFCSLFSYLRGTEEEVSLGMVPLPVSLRESCSSSESCRATILMAGIFLGRRRWEGERGGERGGEREGQKEGERGRRREKERERERGSERSVVDLMRTLGVELISGLVDTLRAWAETLFSEIFALPNITHYLESIHIYIIIYNIIRIYIHCSAIEKETQT